MKKSPKTFENAFNSLNLAVMSHWRHNLLEWEEVYKTIHDTKQIISQRSELQNQNSKAEKPVCHDEFQTSDLGQKKEESLQNILGNAFNSLNLAVMSHWRHNLLEWVRVKSIASIFTEESNPRTKYPVPKFQKDYCKIQKVNKCNK